MSRDIGGWLLGPGTTASGTTGPDAAQPAYRGERLGLPESGPGSLAGLGPRLVAFAIDAVMCDLVALLVGSLSWVSVIFVTEVFVLTWLQGASAGQRIRRLQVVRLDGRPPGLRAALVRTFLLALLIPALVWDRDGRGLHDRAAGTVLVSRV